MHLGHYMLLTWVEKLSKFIKYHQNTEKFLSFIFQNSTNYFVIIRKPFLSKNSILPPFTHPQGSPPPCDPALAEPTYGRGGLLGSGPSRFRSGLATLKRE